MLLSQIIICAVAIISGVFWLCFILKKEYLDHIKTYISKYLVIDNQELSEDESDELYKEKKEKEILERQLLSQSYLAKNVENNMKIVSIIEPIGKWTKLVMNEHLTKLMNMNPDKKNGFWQVFVSMQGMMQGKYRSRGR